MKFYIASRVKNRELVKQIHTKLTEIGHEVLSDWVDERNIIPYEEHVEASEVRALQCVKYSSDCDVFVLVSDESGAGMYTELGIALASSLAGKKPKIYVIGDYLNRSVFFFHPHIKRFKAIEEVLEDLK
jgi:hypothetical protein